MANTGPVNGGGEEYVGAGVQTVVVSGGDIPRGGARGRDRGSGGGGGDRRQQGYK